MQEFVKKLIDRLESRIEYNKLCREEYPNASMSLTYEVQINAYKNAIEIVNQLAGELSGNSEQLNGWIPVSSGIFPEAEDLHNKPVEECKQYLIQRECGVMEVAHYVKIYGKAHFSAHSLEIKDVIAWQPLPQPYQPKGE